MQTYLLTLLGRDRSGLVEAVSRAVCAAGGSWVESRLAHLGGHFAGVVEVRLPEGAALSEFKNTLASLGGSHGLQVEVAEAKPDAGKEKRGECLRLSVVGHDRPGIVAEVSKVLVGAGVNVEEFSSSLENAAIVGGMLFRAEARISLPAGLGAQALRERLEGLSEDLMVDTEEEDAVSPVA